MIIAKKMNTTAAREVVAVVHQSPTPTQTVRHRRLIQVGDIVDVLRLNHPIEMRTMTTHAMDIIVNNNNPTTVKNKKTKRNNLQKLDFHPQPLMPKKIQKQIQMAIPMIMTAVAKAAAIQTPIHQTKTMRERMKTNTIENSRRSRVIMMKMKTEGKLNHIIPITLQEHQSTQPPQITIPHTLQTMKMIPMIRTILKIPIVIMKKPKQASKWLQRRRRRRRRRQRPKQ